MKEFDILKAIGLAQFFIDTEEGKRIEYLKCLKLMYLAERQMYESFRKFITYDNFVSMRHGPVLSYTYDLIRENQFNNLRDQKEWNDKISVSKLHISKNKDLKIDNLFDAHEQIIIEQTAKTFGKIETWPLVDLVHTICDEWKDTESALLITEKDIAKAVGNETAREAYYRIMRAGAAEAAQSQGKEIANETHYKIAYAH